MSTRLIFLYFESYLFSRARFSEGVGRAYLKTRHTGKPIILVHKLGSRLPCRRNLPLSLVRAKCVSHAVLEHPDDVDPSGSRDAFGNFTKGRATS